MPYKLFKKFPKQLAGLFTVLFAVLLLAACESGQVTTVLPSAGTDAKAVAESDGLVLVAGATGGTGKMVVKHLLDDGYDVRVLVRNLDKAEALWGDSVAYAKGDVRRPAELIPAMQGVTSVISAIGASPTSKRSRPEDVDFGGVRNLADVAAASNVQHFVLVSSAGVTQEDHFLNKMFNNVLIWKAKGEDALRASGVPYTIVRPGGLTDKPGGKSVIVFAQGDTTSGSITREDVALICVAALSQPNAVGKTFETYASTAGAPVKTDWKARFASLQSDSGAD